MPLFECGGSTLLQNKQAIAKPSADSVYKASDDGYDGFEQVTVPKFATLGTKSITANGNNQSVISGNNSYSAVNVNVPAAVTGGFTVLNLGSNPVVLNYTQTLSRGNNTVDGRTITLADWSSYRYLRIVGDGPHTDWKATDADPWTHGNTPPWPVDVILTVGSSFVGWGFPAYQHESIVRASATTSTITIQQKSGSDSYSRTRLYAIYAYK